MGLAIGSFLNVVIIRSVKGESLRGRSYCRNCRTQLTAKELIPLISFCVQKGRCRNCGAVLSRQYFWVELASGFLFASAFYFLAKNFGFQLTAPFFWWLFFFWLLASLVIIIFAADWRFQIIPHIPAIILFILGAAATIYRNGWSFSSGLDFAAAFALSLFFFSLWLFSKGDWMGLGDAKLILATSLLVGYPLSTVAFLFSFWLGGIVGAGLLLSGLKTKKSQIPFGPFILLGAFMAYLIGEQFLVWSGLIYLL